jgi:NADP-dependent 3-hydroxy acid dehydrogenase YdfG
MVAHCRPVVAVGMTAMDNNVYSRDPDNCGTDTSLKQSHTCCEQNVITRLNRKIRVNAIAPGTVETEGMHSGGIMGSDFEKTMVASTPLGRIGQPDDIARIAVFLASDDSAWLTGERLAVSGGYR